MKDASEFRTRMAALYGSEYGWQRWFSKTFQIERRTLTRWIQSSNATRIPGWAWTALSLVEQIKILKGEVPMAENKTRGRPPATGRYATRQELCEAVLRDYYINNVGQTDIAKAQKVSYAVVQRIVSIGDGMTTALRKEIKEAKKRKKAA